MSMSHTQKDSLKPLQYSPPPSDTISIIPQSSQLQRPKPIFAARITFASDNYTYKSSQTNHDFHQLKKRNITVVSRVSMREYRYGWFTREAVLRVMKTLKKLKVLFDLSLTLGGHRNIHPFDSMLHVRRLKSLSKLTLVHQFGRKIDNEEIQSLTDNLNRIPTLSSLSLYFSGLSAMTSEQVKSIAGSIRCLPSLSHLSLSFSRGVNITNAGIKIFASRFHCLQSLSSLMLDFSRTSYLTDKGLEDLSLGIERLKSLSKLTLDLSECGGRISFEGIKSLSVAMKCLKLSCEFNLSFSAWTGIHQIGVESLLGSLTYLISISSLTLDFQYSSANDDIIKGLAIGLKHLTQLSHLSLDFKK